MKIYSFCNIEYERAVESLGNIMENSIAIVNFNVNGKINLINEMTDKNGKIRQLAELSKKRKTIFFLGFNSTLVDKIFLSVLVISRGNLLGMSDMTHHLSDIYNLGKMYKCYDIGEVSAGVIVGDDIYFPEVCRTLCLSNAELIIAVHNKQMRELDGSIIAANAYMNGTTIVASYSDGLIIFTEGSQSAIMKKCSEVCIDIEITINNRFLTAVRDNYSLVEEI